eukprot:PITA_09512
MQAYFLRIIEIKNNLLSIGETIIDREMELTALGGLPSKWYVFRTTLLNNNVIPGFEELMARCIEEEEKGVEEQETLLPKGLPAAFSSHAKKRNNSGSKLKRNDGPKDGRKGRCYICNKAGHYSRECPDRKNSHRDDDQNPSDGNQKNDKFNSKGKRRAGNQGMGQPFKKARNSRYESNAVDNKQAGYYLPTALSTSAPLDSMGIWLIDSGASRDFIGYKEVLHNLVEKEINLEIVLGDDMKYLVKGVGNVSLKLNQALIKNQTEKKIKMLRTDNGTEYESNEFHDFCKEAGIKRETTTPYTPEQNGVAERKNRMIMEAVWAMLHDQRLLKFLWAEAANTVVYVQN